MFITIFVCTVLIGIDQLIKWLAAQHLQPIVARTVLPGILELRYVENYGAAFGVLAGRQVFLIIVTGIALLAIGALLVFRRPKGNWEYVALLFIFSGGVGNLIDRIVNGYVVDYANLLFVNFAVFNFADVFVCVGFALLTFAFIRSEVRQHKAKKAMGEEEERELLNEIDKYEEKAATASLPQAGTTVVLSAAYLKELQEYEELEEETDSYVTEDLPELSGIPDQPVAPDSAEYEYHTAELPELQ